MPGRLTVRTDGGARGNPGPAGSGFVIEDESGAIVCDGGIFLGVATNNVAEYTAVVWGLENAREIGAEHVTLVSDSELLVRQLTGMYRVKSPHLKPLFLTAVQLLRSFGSYEVTHVLREFNKAPDALANRAMDAQATVGSPLIEPGSDRLF